MAEIAHSSRTERPTVRVAIGQFANLVGLGLWSVLGEDPGLQIVGTGLDYEALRRVLADDSAPQVVVLDEESALLAVIAGLRDLNPGLGLVVFTHGSTLRARVLRVRLESKPAVACLSTDAGNTDIRAAIRLAAEGQQLIATTGAMARQAAPGDFPSLTAREREVLVCLMNGQRTAQIAIDLHISPDTVNSHIKRIYRKLGINSRAALLDLDLSTVD